jgi:hypothetical protein
MTLLTCGIVASLYVAAEPPPADQTMQSARIVPSPSATRVHRTPASSER